MLSLPLDILHGDDPGFVDDIRGMFPELKTASLLTSDMADKLHDNDFSMIIVSKGGAPGADEMRHRLFPRFDPLNGMSSLVSLLKNRDFVPPDVSGSVAKKIVIALPEQYASSDFVQKLLSGLGVTLGGPESGDEFADEAQTSSEDVLSHAMGHQSKCPMCGKESSDCHDPLTVKESSLKPKITVKESTQKFYLLDTPEGKYMEITTPDQIKTAAAYMNDSGRRVDARVYGVMYENLVGRMLQTGMTPKEAGLYDIKLGSYVKGELIKRANYVPAGEKRDAYFNLYHQIDSITPVKAASVLSALDEATGINKLYSRNLVQTPLDAVTSNIKIAEDLFVFNDPQTGNKVTQFQLEEAAKSSGVLREIEKYLGEDMRSAFEDGPVAAFKHLPDMHKNIIAKILNDRSITVSGGEKYEEDREQETDQPARDGSLVIVEKKL